LKRIGYVQHISSNKNLILKTDKPLRIGDNVVDKSLKPIGKVFDVFGPVSSPYLAIKTHFKDPNYLKNKELYIIQRSKRKGKKRK
jgi:RNA-binding protein